MKSSNPSPRRAIRLKCLDCCIGSSKEVELCPAGIYCSLHQYRKGHRPEGATSPSPIRIIRRYCLQCGEENSYSDVEACPIHDCPFYTFRLGKNPNRTGRILDDEQKAILRERLAGMRAAKMPSLPVEPQPTGLPADPEGSRVDSYPKAEASP